MLIQNPKSKIQNLRRSCRAGQSVVEFVIALLGTMVFFVGMLRVFSWFTVAMVARQRNFDCTRVPAARPMGWAQKHEVDDIKYRPDRDFCGARETGVLPPPPKKLSVWGD